MTPEQKKAEADRLFNQGVEEYYRSQYRQALQSWQQALTIYQEIGELAKTDCISLFPLMT